MARSTSTLRGLLRKALPLLLVGSAALSATACGSSGTSGSGGEKVTLRFTWWGSDTRHAYTQKLIKQYEASHPNITIKADYSNFNDYWNKLATAVASGNTPDVMQQESRYVREYADRGALADLSSYLGSTIKNADFDPSVASAGTINGKTYAIATGVNAFTMVANPAIFQKAGVTMPNDATWTWDDLRNTAAAITKAAPKGTYGLQEPGYVDASLEIFARQRGEGLYTPDGKLAVTQDTLTAWFSFVQSLTASKATPVPSLSVEVQAGGVDRSLLATGKGAMGVWWTNELSALSKAAGGVQLVQLRMPGDAAKPGTFFKPAMFWSIGAHSKHPREAADFVNYLLNDQAAAKLILSDRGMPINLKLRAAIEPDLKPADKQSAAFIDKIRPNIGAPAVLPPKGAGNIQTILQKINEQVIFKKMTPSQAATEFLQQANAAISS